MVSSLWQSLITKLITKRRLIYTAEVSRLSLAAEFVFLTFFHDETYCFPSRLLWDRCWIWYPITKVSLQTLYFSLFDKSTMLARLCQELCLTLTLTLDWFGNYLWRFVGCLCKFKFLCRQSPDTVIRYTDKKEKKIFHYKGIQTGSVAKS